MEARLPEASSPGGVEKVGAAPEGEALEVARRLGEPLEETVCVADVDLADVAWAVRGPGLLDEVEIPVAAAVGELEVLP